MRLASHPASFENDKLQQLPMAIIPLFPLAFPRGALPTEETRHLPAILKEVIRTLAHQTAIGSRAACCAMQNPHERGQPALVASLQFPTTVAVEGAWQRHNHQISSQ
jgi:hypothetical protein